MSKSLCFQSQRSKWKLLSLHQQPFLPHSRKEFTNILMTYPFFASTGGQYVATCLEETSKPLVTRCEAGFTANLTQILPVCNVNCRGTGNYVYPNDETKFYQCIWNGRAYAPIVTSCLRNYYYNPTTNVCERKSNTPAPVTQVPTTEA